MNNLLEYSGVVTKIRAMQKNLLTDDDFREIVAMPDVAAVEAYLKKNPAYAEAFSNINENDIHREALEAVFGSNVYRDFAKIYNFADPDQEKFLKKYARRYEIKLLKKCLKYAIAGRAPGDEILWHKDFFKKFLSLDVEALHECTSLDMTLKAVENTEYYPVLMRVRNGGRAEGFDYETALDMYHFSSIWKDRTRIVSGDSVKAISRIYGSRFDMLNIWFIKRAKQYYEMPEAEIYTLIIPVLYRLRQEDIRALVTSESEDQFAAALAQTFYGKQYENLAPDNLEDMYGYVLRDVLRQEAKKHPYSAATLYRYLYLKEHEGEKLIAAVECVRYGIDPDEAFKYINAV